ncbi:Hypothetical Protein LMG19145_01326 [Xanthomonas arboricola pv. fragariae]|nr:Hypothetical Protein LMG19145_01326 [Xanthomonas arboricola pv. fragariae]
MVQRPAIVPIQAEQRASFGKYRLTLRAVSSRLRDPWRHGCRQGASRDGFTACPASDEGTARSTHRVFELSIWSRPDNANVLSRDWVRRLCFESSNNTDRSVVERLLCGLAGGPLPAHPRGTRRKYVRVGSYAASMPRKVPRRWAGKDLSRWLVCVVVFGDPGCADRSAVDRRILKPARAPRPRPCFQAAKVCGSAANATASAPLPTLTMPVRLITLSNNSTLWV